MADPSIEVRAFKPSDAQAFAALNTRWIEELFGLEDEDRRVLSAPQESIVDEGGYIAVALIADEIVGTGALMVPGNADEPRKWLELVKMATSPAAQGRGVGGSVLDHLIAIARTREAEAIWLETNNTLAAATRLYKRKGFQPLSKSDEHPTPYSRCNLQMVLRL